MATQKKVLDELEETLLLHFEGKTKSLFVPNLIMLDDLVEWISISTCISRVLRSIILSPACEEMTWNICSSRHHFGIFLLGSFKCFVVGDI